MPFSSQWSGRIGTNYIPLPHEVDQLKILVDTGMEEVHAIDKEIEHLRLQISSLDARRTSQMKVVQEYRALLSTARVLPAEILSQIFIETLQAYSKDRPSSRMGKHPGNAVSQVCLLWREIAIGLPSLWSVIDIWLPNHPTRILRKRYGIAAVDLPSEEQGQWTRRVEGWKRRVQSIGDMLELYLVRSVDRPLTIAFSAKEADVYTPNDERLLVQRLVGAIVRSYPRLESVTLKFKVEDDASPFARLLVVDPHQIPLLRTAQLSIKPREVSDAGDPGSQNFMFQGPLLTSIALHTRWYFIQYMRGGIDWANLVDLRLCTIRRGHIVAPDIYSAMEILRLCPKLVRCALEFEHDIHENLPDHERTELYPITLLHLRQLTIYGHGVHLFMSRALRLPLLENLSILDMGYDPYNGEEDEIPDGIIPWALKYGQQLKHVAFEYGCLSQDQFVPTLRNLQAVVSLNLSGVVDYAKVAPNEDVDIETRVRWAAPARLSNDVLRWLTPSFGDAGARTVEKCFCPKLRRVECVTGDLDFNESGFLDFVAARRLVDPVFQSEISSLEEVVLKFSSKKQVDFENELERRGIETSKFGLRVEYSGDSGVC